MEKIFARVATEETLLLAGLAPGFLVCYRPLAPQLRKWPPLGPSLRRIAKTCGTRLLVYYCERWTIDARARGESCQEGAGAAMR